MPEQKTGLVVTAHPGDFVWRAGGAIGMGSGTGEGSGPGWGLGSGSLDGGTGAGAGSGWGGGCFGGRGTGSDAFIVPCGARLVAPPALRRLARVACAALRCPPSFPGSP